MKGLIILICLFISPIAQAGTYRWVDENGQTHFGDRPPVNTAADEIALESAPASPDEGARERTRRMKVFLEQSEKERAASNEAEARQEAMAAKQAAHCASLRARLKYLRSVSGIYRLNPEGERVFVNDEENERIRKEFRARVQKECGS